MENYIQYAAGFSKKDITVEDIRKALKDLQEMDEEHGAFWVGVVNEERRF